MGEYVTAIEGFDFDVTVDGRHLHVSVGLRQVAVMRVTRSGDFEWGWVGRDAGRDDFWDWAAWWKALRKVKVA